MRAENEKTNSSTKSVKIREEDPIKTQVEWGQLVDLAFALPKGHSFTDDFPVWNAAYGAKIHRWCLRGANKELLSTVSARIADLQTKRGVIKTALIGAVASKPGFHGRGLASQCLEAALDWTKQKGEADLVVLWGSELQFYSKFGFELCGEQCQVSLEQVIAQPMPNGATVEIGWNPQIFDLMKVRKTGLKLVATDQMWMESHKNTLWCWLKQNGIIRAYIGVGRGIDLPNMVHEWGGSPIHLRALLNKVREKIPNLTLLGPSTLIQDYGLVANPWELKPEKLCLSKIMNPEKISNFDQLEAWIWGLDGA